MENQKKKFNVLVFILLLLVFFPAAIIYAIRALANPNAKPKNGFISRLVYCIGALLNVAIMLSFDDMIIYMAAPLVVFLAMLAMTILGKVKADKLKLFTIIYTALLVLIMIPILSFGFWLYLLGTLILLPFAIVGIVRGLGYPAAMAKWTEANAECEAATECEAAE